MTGITAPDEGFGHNVTAFERAYPGWIVQGDGSGLLAWRRNDKGRASGRPIRARTLDELAGQIDASSGNA